MRRLRRLRFIEALRPGRSRLAFLGVFAAGGLLTLAFPEPDVAPLGWVAIAPLVGAASGTGARRGFALGTVFGVGFFGGLLYWVSIVGYAAWATLVLLQALYVGAFGAAWGAVSRRTGPVLGLVLPAVLWVGLVEYLRSVTPVVGFTWGQLAQAQHDMGFLLKAAGWGGGWTVALLVVVANTLVAAAAAAARERNLSGAAARVAAAGAVLLAPAPWPASRATGAPVDVAIVQGNIPEHEPPSYEKDLTILSNHSRLTASVPPEADLVLWAESSVGIDPYRDPAVSAEIAAAAEALARPMVVGGNRARDDGRYQVMAYQVSAEGEIVDEYQKTHLVPFGEYVPARRFLDWIPALGQVPLDAVPGDEGVVFDVAGGAVAPVISFEADFGGLVSERVDEGGRLLVVLTNTSTWRHSWASAQHVAMSQVRAAETGVWVAHAALTGISAFVDPSGDVVGRTELWEPDVLVQRARFAEDVTLYARTGDWLPLGALGVSLWCLLATRERWSRLPLPGRRP